MPRRFAARSLARAVSTELGRRRCAPQSAVGDPGARRLRLRLSFRPSAEPTALRERRLVQHAQAATPAVNRRADELSWRTKQARSTPGAGAIAMLLLPVLLAGRVVEMVRGPLQLLATP